MRIPERYTPLGPCKYMTEDPFGNWVDLADYDQLNADLDALRAERDKLVAALDRIFSSYKMLADSGDAGNWSLEALPEGMQAMEALAKYRVDGKLVTSCYN